MEQAVNRMRLEQGREARDAVLRPERGETRCEHHCGAILRFDVQVELGAVELTNIFGDVDASQHDVGEAGQGTTGVGLDQRYRRLLVAHVLEEDSVGIFDETDANHH